MTQTKQQDASTVSQDTAYTANHAFACTVTDLLNPYIGNFTQAYLGKRINVGCKHDHVPTLPMAAKLKPTAKPRLFSDLQASNEAGGYKRMRPVTACDHDVPAPQSNLKHWWIGELAGDFGAVPVTVVLQRFAPGLMRSIRRIMEPLLAPLFHHGAKRATQAQAAQQGQEAAKRENDIYEREMSHLPQALVWTVSSTAINLVTQRLSGNKGPIAHIVAGKLAGSATSAALVIGFRGFTPQQAHRFDQFTSSHLFEPASRIWQKKLEAEEDQKITYSRV